LYFGCMHTLSKYTPKSEVHGLWRCWVNVRDVCGQAAFSLFGFGGTSPATPSVQQCMAQPGAVLPQCKMLPSVLSSCEQDVAELCGQVTTPGQFIGCIWKHRFQVSPACKAKYEMLSGHYSGGITPPAVSVPRVAVSSPVAASPPAAVIPPAVVNISPPAVANAPATSSPLNPLVSSPKPKIDAQPSSDGKGPLWKCMAAATTICKGQDGASLAQCAMRMVKVSPVCRVPIGEVVTGCGEDAHSYCATIEMGVPVLRCLQQYNANLGPVCSSLLKNNEPEDAKFNAEVHREWQNAMAKGSIHS